MPWQKVALIGVGLLGGSIGLALRQGRLAHSVVGYVRRPEAIVECQKIGVVDSATTDLQDAVQGADLVILCTPLGQMRDLTAKILPHLNSGAIITDVGSVKHSVHDALEPLCQNAGITFVGSHPMAGSEKMGVTAARVDLFQNALCVITALETTPAPAVQRIEKFWSSLGARILHLSHRSRHLHRTFESPASPRCRPTRQPHSRPSPPPRSGCALRQWLQRCDTYRLKLARDVARYLPDESR